MFCQSTVCLFYRYALTKLLKNVSQVVSVSYKKNCKLWPKTVHGLAGRVEL